MVTYVEIALKVKVVRYGVLIMLKVGLTGPFQFLIDFVLTST